MELVYFIFIIFIVMIISKIYSHFSKKRYIKSKWGKLPSTDFVSETKEKYLIKAFRNLLEKNNDEVVDDYTYNDLELYKIFKKIDATSSNLGSSMLFYRMRTLLKDEDDMKRFVGWQRYFEENEKKRVNAQYQFSKLGKKSESDVLGFIKNMYKVNMLSVIVHSLMSLTSIIVLVLMLLGFNPTIGFIFPLIFSINIGYTIYLKNNMKESYDSANYLINTIKVASNISKMDIPNIEKLKKSFSKVKSIRFLSFLYYVDGFNGNDFFIYFLDMAFLISVVNYTILNYLTYNNKLELFELWESLGDIDAAISVLNYKNTIDDYCEPIFNDDYRIFAKDIYHPLLENPVKNDVSWDENILVTGSNASGKSTYVKSIAINAIFAQSIYIALASEFTMKKGRVFTSMAIKDDVESGDSYFIAEIKSLERIVSDAKKGNQSYYFVDEILKGTNTKERIAASTSILDYFVEKNILSFVATHDIELTELLKSKVRNIHFREHFTENGDIAFDYKLHEGPSITSNAIKLLEIYNFPKDIVEKSVEIYKINK